MSKTHLLLENVSDSHLYGIIGDFFLKRTGIKGRISFYPANGNGGELINIFKQTGQDTPCLCIVDSDTLSPFEQPAPRTTAHKLINSPSPHILSRKCILTAHEKENLIPYPVLIDYRRDNGGIDKRTESLIKFIGSSHKIFSYADIKNGLTVQDVVSKCRNEKSFKIWSFAARHLIHLLSGANQKLNCLRCHYARHCTIKIVPKIGISSTKITPYINEFLKTHNICKYQLFRTWKKLGQIISNWCCAPFPSPSL